MATLKIDNNKFAKPKPLNRTVRQKVSTMQCTFPDPKGRHIDPLDQDSPRICGGAYKGLEALRKHCRVAHNKSPPLHPTTPKGEQKAIKIGDIEN